MSEYYNTHLANAPQIVQLCFDGIYKYFSTSTEWKAEAETLINKASGGKIRIFQTFFEDPKDLIDNKTGQLTFKIQALEYKDIERMYPQLLTHIGTIEKDHFIYVFTCNNALPNNHALIIHTYI